MTKRSLLFEYTYNIFHNKILTPLHLKLILLLFLFQVHLFFTCRYIYLVASVFKKIYNTVSRDQIEVNEFENPNRYNFVRT